MLVGHTMPETGSTTAVANPLLQALLFDAQTMDVEWQQVLHGVKDGYYGSGNHERPDENFYYSAGITPDPARQRIYIAHADEAKLTTIDFSAQAVKSIEIREKQTTIERFLEFILSIGVQPVQAKAANSYVRQALLSQDGSTLYVAGEQNNMLRKNENELEMISTPLGLEAWDLKTGTRLYVVETNASEIRQGPQGLIVLNGYDRSSSTYRPFTDIFDPAAAQIAAHLDETYAYATLRLDGELALVSVYSTDENKTFLGVLNAKALRKELSWAANSYYFWPEFR